MSADLDLNVGTPPEMQKGDGLDLNADDMGKMVDVDLGDGKPKASGGAFEANLADSMDDTALSGLGQEIVDDVERDRESREPWEKLLARGIEELGFDRSDDRRSDPFPGASAVRHPLLANSIFEFNARVMREVFPADGPLKVEFVGDSDPNIVDQAARVRDYGNWLLTHGMPDFRSETDRLFTLLPLAGSMFRKVNPGARKLPNVETIHPSDFLVPYGAKSLQTTPRATHVLRLHEHEVRSRIASGLWRDVPLMEAQEDTSESQDKANRVLGLARPADLEDDRYVIYECHCVRDLDDGEGEAPYIITVCSETGTVLSIYRNWDETDPDRLKLEHFVHYKFLSFDGFYGVGLWHLVGGLNAAATAALRQLLDAGALANTNGGFTTTGIEGGNNDITLQPNQWQKVKPPGGAPNSSVRDMFLPYPFKEPSTTLYQLLQYVVDQGSQFASVVTKALAEANEQAPVGTTIALIEQHSAVFTAIHGRQHWAMSEEFELVRRVIFDFGPDELTCTFKGRRVLAARTDFDGSVAMIPAADPGSFSTVIRAIQAQALLQVATQVRQQGVDVDMRAVAVKVATDLGLRKADSYFPAPKPPQPPQPLDPVSEFQAVLRAKPAQAHTGQNHEAHIAALTAMGQNPTYAASLDPGKQAALAALVADHVACLVEEQVYQAMGQQPPAAGQPLPPQVEWQQSVAVAGAARALAAQASSAQTPQQPGAPVADPAATAAMEAETRRKQQADAVKFQLDAAKVVQKTELEQAKIASDEQIARERMSLEAGMHLSQQASDVQQQAAQPAQPPGIPVA